MPLSSVVGAQSIVKPGVCTSSTRPASPYVGQCIYETDTLLAKVWNGSTWADYPEGKLTATTANTSGRNLLINGDFKVWQRGSSRAFLAAGGTSYLADRWCVHLYQGAGHERVAGRATQYAIRVSSSSTAEAAGGTRMWLTQKVESLNSYRLRSQPVTLSFWVRFSDATATSSTATPYGNWTAAIGYYNTTTDSATATTDAQSVSTLVLTNGSLPTTWTKYSVTGTCPSDLNNIHATFGFGGLGNTASNSGVWYEIAEVQLEAGAVATPFEFEDYQVTLAKCQRYYESVSWGIYYAAALNGTDIYLPLSYKVTKRVAPTVTLPSSTNAIKNTSNANATPIYAWTTNGTTDMFNIYAGSNSIWAINAGTATASAEL